MRALIIEDDRILSNNICESLRRRFDTAQAFDGEEGLGRLCRERFDVVVLDVMMPRLNGYEVLEQMRDIGVTTPVLMLTALDTAADQVRALRAGADDCLPRSFDQDVFQARLDALVRRAHRAAPEEDHVLTLLDLVLDTNTRTARIGENRLELRGRQFDLLRFLLENKNVVVHKERLFRRVWGVYSSTDFSVVEVYASQLRRALRPYDYEKYLKTVRGVGYILTDDSGLYG